MKKEFIPINPFDSIESEIARGLLMSGVAISVFWVTTWLLRKISPYPWKKRPFTPLKSEPFTPLKSLESNTPRKPVKPTDEDWKRQAEERDRRLAELRELVEKFSEQTNPPNQNQ